MYYDYMNKAKSRADLPQILTRMRLFLFCSCHEPSLVVAPDYVTVQLVVCAEVRTARGSCGLKGADSGCVMLDFIYLFIYRFCGGDVRNLRKRYGDGRG